VIRLAQGGCARGSERVSLAAAAAALRGRLADPRAEEALVFEPIERRVEALIETSRPERAWISCRIAAP